MKFKFLILLLMLGINQGDSMQAQIETSKGQIIIELEFEILATSGTAQTLIENGVDAKSIFKVGEGRPNVVDAIKNNEIQMVINTPMGAQSRFDEYEIGKSAIRHKIPAITTISGAQAAVRGIRNIKNGNIKYRSLQEVFG